MCGTFNIKKAADQMYLAVKANDGNFYEKSIAEARLKQLKTLLMDEKSKKNI